MPHSRHINMYKQYRSANKVGQSIAGPTEKLTDQLLGWLSQFTLPHMKVLHKTKSLIFDFQSFVFTVPKCILLDFYFRVCPIISLCICPSVCLSIHPWLEKMVITFEPFGILRDFFAQMLIQIKIRSSQWAFQMPLLTVQPRPEM